MEKRIYELLKEKYNYDFDSEFFTDEMVCLVDDVIKATVEVVNSKKPAKPITVRMASFTIKVNETTGTYPGSMKQEFIEYWTEHGENDRKMRFEKEKSFCIQLRLKTWLRRSRPLANQSKRVNSEWYK